ncbi:Cullin repeat-like-containing domain [Pseudocohnilembus persalinus]|uniref:Cullin repeat-like-containing domain n=1 Tax=Pseudocohnilembus persalinus TaxID=266149 RepID=A0A0V0QN28_PSEPJ|nr:Cullin repeat-like-containing domain [Pseudocohnilembus persalinus]|eukprot:KRX03349.1 Cullin repeat-like-containing domain [Pseudocohnilembus persalinus]
MEAQDPRKLYELSIKSIDKRNEQLKSFLQDNKTIKITNQEYMEMYNYILQTSDAGANPSTSSQQQKTQNLVKQQWITLSTPEYVTEVLKALEKEKEIAKYYYPRSQKKMIQIIEQIAIINNGETVATHPVTGVLHMLENQKDDQLKDIYNLFNHSIDVRKTLEYISTQFQEFLVNQGRNQNKAADQLREEKKPQKEISKEYISNISDLRQKSERLIKEVFNSDLILINARDKSFQQFLNEYERATFYLAQYSDNLLKSDQFNNEQEVDDQLQNILNIFFSLYSRDTFFKHYQRFLSSRLLNSTSKNSQAEQNLIAKFKSEAGQQAVSKIVTMLQDIKQSQEMMQENGSKLQNECSYEMTVNVLTKGCWPLQSTQIGQQDLEPQIRVPQKLKLGINVFETIYKKKYHGRNLDWIYSQGTGVVNFLGQDDRDKTKPSKYTIQCNSYQLLIFLTLQENNNKLTFSKLLEDTQINKEELDFNLQPCFKLKILNRVQKDGPVQESEEVSVNMNFSFKQRKIKCIPGGKAANTKQDKEHQQNQDKLKKEIDQERTYVIEACLVRIMKGKRSAKVNELIPECIQMITNFKAEIPPIKKSIDSLIERDYLRRKQDDFTTVEYPFIEILKTICPWLIQQINYIESLEPEDSQENSTAAVRIQALIDLFQNEVINYDLTHIKGSQLIGDNIQNQGLLQQKKGNLQRKSSRKSFKGQEFPPGSFQGMVVEEIRETKQKLSHLRHEYYPDNNLQSIEKVQQIKNEYHRVLDEFLKFKKRRNEESEKIKQKHLQVEYINQANEMKLREKSLQLKNRDIDSIKKLIFELEKEKIVEDNKQLEEKRKQSNQITMNAFQSIENEYKNRIQMLKEKLEEKKKEREIILKDQVKNSQNLEKDIKKEKQMQIQQLTDLWQMEKERQENIEPDEMSQKIKKIYQKY